MAFCIYIVRLSRIILNYLRTGELIYPKENKILTKELYLEAKFYQVVNIQKEIWPKLAFENSSYIIGNLNEGQKSALLSWLPEKHNFVTWVQLYSSTSHGWFSSSVHQRCDNSGPIIVIARAGNNIFGGYAEVSWSSGNTVIGTGWDVKLSNVGTIGGKVWQHVLSTS